MSMSAWLAWAGVAWLWLVCEAVALRGGGAWRRLVFSVRGASVLLLASGLWMVLWGAVGKPWLAAVVLGGGMVFVTVLHVMKRLTLQEDLVVTDIWLFRMAFVHPQLYFSFAPNWLLWLGAIAVPALPLLVWVIEPTQPWLPGAWRALLLIVAIGTAYGLRYWLGGRFNALLSADIHKDMQTYGLMGSVVLYWLGLFARPMTVEQQIEAGWERIQVPALRAERLPHLVAVQSESFVDLRRWLPGIVDEHYRLWDEAKRQVHAHGLMRVPAWGANTMRAEYGFLTAIPFVQQGVLKYNPYAQVPKQALMTLPKRLREMGYRTVCVHPFDRRFFQRHRVMPAMGFERFVTEDAFAHAERHGRYVADQAVGEWMHAELDAAKEPTFLFAITMENHGPWPLQRLLPEQWRQYDAEDELLGTYLWHTQQAQAMLHGLMQRDDAMGCWYGDHPPALTRYTTHDKRDVQDVDYVCWGSVAPHTANDVITPDQLARIWLPTAG